jgi:hypothetical protein
MQYGSKPIMSVRQSRPVASLAGRSKRWTSSAARPEQMSPQNAQRNYERYLALARAEANPRWIKFSEGATVKAVCRQQE